MQRRTLLAGSAALLAAPLVRPALAEGGMKVVFWHAMTATLADEVNRLAAAFNAAQTEVTITPVYKGGYADTMTATIAAFRAGQAPHLVQIFEVGTASMLAAGKAVKQIWELTKETGAAIDPGVYIPAVRDYYSLADGRMAAMPFNSSTAVMWINKDAFARAGLDPAKPPETWPEVEQAARTIKAKGAANVALTTSWPCWIQFEQYSALHDIPFATKANGFEGLDTELAVNNPAQVRHVERLLALGKEGVFRYAGRDTAPDPMIESGQAAISFGSSAQRGNLVKNAKFAWAPAMLPYDPAIIAKPRNSIIGGASLWPMTAPGRTPAEYNAVARFLLFLSTPENAAAWHQNTGYVPVTTAGYELSRKQGYYERNPGADLPIAQLLHRGTPDANTRGVRLGRLPEIRNIVQEEFERALAGEQAAQPAMDAAVRRANKVLREFQRSV
ncbi:MAG: sn-glycerol-3-phosphate ABC transporter substrate-binding protein UgpB [Acetobacteraceae bacterium]|nr:sn-glycerol-3-phosphate ABC transporter substrate-binding protein UgpB [Acetobacteraceae bacterium]